MENIENNDLWEKFRGGDKSSLFEIYTNVYFQLYRYGIRIHPDSDFIKDTISQLFLKLWDKQSVLPSVTNIYAYLCISLKNLIADNLKAYNVYEKPFDVNIVEQSYEELLISSESDKEMKHKLRKALQTLTPTQLRLIELKFFYNHSYEQIAKDNILSVKTVYNTIYDAIKRLRFVLLKKS